MEHFVNILMQMEDEANPEDRINYASNFSLMSHTLIFMANFGIFMIYSQLALLNQGVTRPFFLPMFVQFFIFFFQVHPTLELHIKILAVEQ